MSTTRAIASMTGFGQAEAHVAGARVTIELKGVNHRYLDLAVKGPREYAALEPRMLELVRSRVKRGKVDVFVTRRPEASDPSAVRADVDLARGVHRALGTIAKELGLPADDISIGTLAQWREIVTVGSGVAEPEADRAAVEGALTKALEKFLAMRLEEGGRLATDLSDRVRELAELTAKAKSRAPKIVDEHRAKLSERLAKLLGDNALDPQRLAQEVAVLADRADVHEELVRLESHLEQLRSTIAAGGEVGRRLDFLLQEVGRETNTLGSKANDAELGKIVVELKAVAERIREQAQNLE